GFFGFTVVRAEMYLVKTDHQAFVGDSVELVELRFVSDFRIRQIQVVRPRPTYLIGEVCSAEEVRMLAVVSCSSSPAGAKAEYPDLAKRVVKHAAAISHPSGLYRFAPV